MFQNHLMPNFLSICIQPDEGIHLRFETKVPDTVSESRSVNMSHSYLEAFPGVVLPDAYERLYPRNSWGPGAADELLAKGGHAWRMGCCGLPCSLS